MKAIKKKKSVDAVAMMREIRDKLSKEYLNNPEAEEKELEQIRNKYSIKSGEKV